MLHARYGAVVCVLAVAALLLRLLEADQSLFGDELFTYEIVTENGFFDVPSAVANSAITPPLHYLLAWAPARVGDPTAWIRVPSVILGSATVLLVYVLGLRTVGGRAGVVAAALVAIAPFAIFYGTENRAYATLGFLSALSTLLLLRALRQGGWPWWIAFGVTTAGVLYTHYTGVFVVAAQLAWSLWAYRDRAREILLVNAAVLLAYLPWVGAFLDQRDTGAVQAERFEGRFPLSLETVAEMFAHALPADPLVQPGGSYIPLDDLPGRAAVAALWVTIGAALLAGAARWWRRGHLTPSRESALIVVLALATPVGLCLYGLQPDRSLLVARNLSASFPALMVLVGWLLTSLRPRLAVVATAVVLGVTGLAATKMLADDYRRPPYDEVARFIDEAASPGDTVVSPGLFSDLRTSTRPLEVHLTGEYEFVWANPGDRQSWSRAAVAPRVFVVEPGSATASGDRYGHLLGRRFSLKRSAAFAGFTPVAVFEYEQADELADRNLIGRTVTALRSEPPLRGEVYLDAPGKPGSVTGWITTPVRDGQRIAIVVDGRVRDTTGVFPQNGVWRFKAVVSPYRPGADRVGVFAVRREGRERRLAALGGGGAGTARLEGSGERPVLLLPSGRRIEVRPGDVGGRVEQLITPTSDVLVVEGWAARATDHLLIFDGAKPVGVGGASAEGPDGRSEFVMGLVTESADELATGSQMRVIALSGGRASVLATPQAPPPRTPPGGR